MASSSSFKNPSVQNITQKPDSSFTPVIQTLAEDLRNMSEAQRSNKAPESHKEEVHFLDTENEPRIPLKQKLSNKESRSPFGITPPKESLSQMAVPAPMLENGLPSTLPNGELLSNQLAVRHTPAWVLYSIALSIIFVALGIGVWYFFFYLAQSEIAPSTPAVNEQRVEMTQSVPVQQPPFSLDKPNYLSLNTEIVSSADIKTILAGTADRIKGAGITVPVEFFVTDQNNNPLAFSRLAFLFDIGLNTDLLALIQETFSLYAYNDAGQVRFGLALDFKDKDAAVTLLTQTESELPYALRSLIIEPNITVAKKLVFRSSQYNQWTVRFTNIDSSQNISFDYAVRDRRMFIGMSKNTLRALLDTYAR